MKGGCGHGKQKRRASVQSVSGERCTENGAWASKVLRQEGGKRGRGTLYLSQGDRGVTDLLHWILFIQFLLCYSAGSWTEGQVMWWEELFGVCRLWMWGLKMIAQSSLAEVISVGSALYSPALSLSALSSLIWCIFHWSLFIVYHFHLHSFLFWLDSFCITCGTPNQSHIIIMYKFETITPKILFFLVVPNC